MHDLIMIDPPCMRSDLVAGPECFIPYSFGIAVGVCLRLVSKPAFILHASMPEESKPFYDPHGPQCMGEAPMAYHSMQHGWCIGWCRAHRSQQPARPSVRETSAPAGVCIAVLVPQRYSVITQTLGYTVRHLHRHIYGYRRHTRPWRGYGNVGRS